MDLSKETSTAGRVLAARHISADHTTPEINNAVNSSLLCYSLDPEPSFEAYFEAVQGFAPALWAGAATAVLVTGAVCALSLRAARRRRPGSLAEVAFVLAVYPAVSALGLMSLVVPRCRLVAEAVAQQVVMVALYQLFCLLVADCGGPEQLVRNKLTTLRYLVLQMPIVQGIIYVVNLIIWSESMEVYLKSFHYIQPFVATSVLLGVWGMIMCVKAAEAAGSRPRGRFLSVQLTLVVVKLQGGCVKLVPELVRLPCLLRLHPVVFVNVIHCSVMIVEMLLLSLWARRLFCSPVEKFSAVLEETPKDSSHLEK